MKNRQILFLLSVCLAASGMVRAQRNLISYKKSLERFREYGAMVISPDTEMISVMKQEITFGEIFGKKEADPRTFKGVFIVEYSNTAAGSYAYYATNTNIAVYTGFFLAVNDTYLKAGEHPAGLKKSMFIAALRIPSELREKLPMYCAILNGLIRLTYEQDKDVSVLPEDKHNVVNRALGKKVLQIKEKELLIARYEAGKTIEYPDAIKNVYPYAYKIVELPDVVKAFNDREAGKTIMVTTMLENYIGKYIVDCETHELLYGRQHIGRSRYVHDSDLEFVNEAIRNAE